MPRLCFPRAFTIALVAFAAAGCASHGGGREAAAPKPIDVSQLPSPHFRTDGSQPLYLKVSVSDGKVTEVAQADEASANVVVTFQHRDASITMVNIKTKPVGVGLKWDLHISPDNQHYAYTSSCPRPPVANEFVSSESWPYAVAWLAISNIRALPDTGMMSCS